MHPDLGEGAFSEWYAGERVVGIVQALVGCGEGDVQMGAYTSQFQA